MISNLEKQSLSELINISLKEDIGNIGDITTDAILKNNEIERFELILKEEAVISGLNVFKEVFYSLDKNILIESNFKDGDFINAGECILELEGDSKKILLGERTALNFISHLSGISTLTREIVNLLRETNTILLDTRKTTPCLRDLEKYAVFCGGGKNHRKNLSELILIKDNHIAVANGVKNAISLAKEKASELLKKGNKIKIEIEVENYEELNQAILSNPDIIMFDNWEIEDLKKAIKLVPKNIKTEVSGMISLENIRSYALIGVDYISTSYMIKNSKWIDFSLEVKNK